MKRFLVGLALFALTLPAFPADEKEQAKFLRQLFSCPESEWTQVLNENTPLLDDSFFERCEARIKWDMANNQVEDALRFAYVCDLASEVTGRPAKNYRLELKRAFDSQPE